MNWATPQTVQRGFGFMLHGHRPSVYWILCRPWWWCCRESVQATATGLAWQSTRLLYIYGDVDREGSMQQITVYVEVVQLNPPGKCTMHTHVMHAYRTQPILCHTLAMYKISAALLTIYIYIWLHIQTRPRLMPGFLWRSVCVQETGKSLIGYGFHSHRFA